MATPKPAPRRGHPVPKSETAPPAGTIRVAKPIHPVSTIQAAIQARHEAADEVDLGLPCSGRCGHCNHHPCRLHASI